MAALVDLSLIIPAYKEADNLRLLLPQLHQILQTLVVSYEILVVDTVEPMDDTEQVCAQHQVRYVRRSPSNDFGDAVRTGILQAQGKYLIFMDGDGSHTPSFIPSLYACVPEYDVVIASRYIDGGATENSKSLILMSKVLNVIYGLTLGIKVKDISNSFKLYRADMLKPLVLHCKNFDIIEEILFKLCRQHKNIKIKEVPFTFKQRVHGETKRELFKFILSYFTSILKIRLSVLFKKA